MTRIKQQSGNAPELIPEKCFETLDHNSNRLKLDPCWKQFLSEEVIHFKNETHGAKFQIEPSLAEILDNLTHGLFIVDEKRRIYYFNTAAEQITGLATDDVKGRSCEDVFEITNSEADCRLQKVIQGGENILNQEGTITRIDGKAVPIICSTLVLKNPHGRVIGGMEVFKDISVRKGLEADLKRTEGKYNRIFEGSKDMIFITSRDGKIKDVNQAGIDLMGYTDKQEVLSLESMENLYGNRRHWRVFQKQIDLHGYVKDFEARFKKRTAPLSTAC